MAISKLGVLLVAAALSSCATGPGDVYVMRHLERDAGADPGLNVVGAINARRLARWFDHDRPVAIFVTPFRRARETAEPLAAQLGIDPVEYDPRQQAQLTSSVGAIKGPVLIIGHSNTVPDIVRVLGGDATPELSDSDYGRIWLVSRRGKPSRVVLLADPQPR